MAPVALLRSAATAGAVILGINDAPMVPGRLSEASCRISARHPGYEATAIHAATFSAPHGSPRRIRLAVRLAGTGGVMGVDCPRATSNNAYCRWGRAHP